MATELQEENLTREAAQASPPPAGEAPPAEAPPAGETSGEVQPGEVQPGEVQPAEVQPAAGPEGQRPKNKRSLLLPLLTILLVALGLGEAVFWGCFGFASYRSSLAAARYKAQQQALEEERAATAAAGGSAYGPNWKIENGRVTWERETPLSDASAGSDGGVFRREDGLRLANLAIPNIPYTLAKMEEDETAAAPAQPAAPEEGTVPTSA